ncbi:proton-coupled zinc antiporter SLC30A1-like [Anolis sagrei]|uniref:proton-coupled zinc antiporter SLC30A1-like n=1 Tax=Anolis sagrei TaxID=38937 RepID=UPI00351FD9D1
MSEWEEADPDKGKARLEGTKKVQMGAHLRRKHRSGVDWFSLLTVDSTICLVVQLCILFAFFLVEVMASRVTGSLLLLSSAFHTLGGAMGLAVALADIWLTSRWCHVQKDTFGGARVQILGTLVSAMFQSSLYLTLLPEAVIRVVAPRITEHTLALMGIGAVGILVHLVRAWLNKRHFQDVGPKPCCSKRRITQADGCALETEDLLQNGSSGSGRSWTVELSPTEFAKKAGQLILDWMVACLGPMAVFLYSITYHLLLQRTQCVDHTACLNDCPTCSIWNRSASLEYTQMPCWLLYLDPGLAIVVAVTLLLLAWPALHGSSLVLLQAVPDHLDLHLLEQHLCDTEGVVALKELNLWQLDGPTSLIATAHVCCLDVTQYQAVINSMQQVFGEHGIHATTVQPHLSLCPAHSDATQYKKCLASNPAEVIEYETTV